MEQTSGAIALEFAGFWRRLVAFIIDAIILSVISSALFPFKWFGWADLWNGSWYWAIFPILAVSNMINVLIDVAYHAGFWTWRGQTLGKMLLNIKVIRTDGSNITLGYSLLRYLGYIISGIMLGIGFLWIAFDPHKQGIHDKIADTYVVRLPEIPHTQPVFTSPRASAG
jgi:uncharacterized RDD family membrane protein YckC